MAKNSPHRNRRHLYDQLVSMDWALERFVSAKGPNKDFDFLPEDRKEAFEVLHKFLGKVKSAYENYLWDVSAREEKMGTFDESKFPVNLQKKLGAVRDYMEEVGHHKKI